MCLYSTIWMYTTIWNDTCNLCLPRSQEPSNRAKAWLVLLVAKYHQRSKQSQSPRLFQRLRSMRLGGELDGPTGMPNPPMNWASL